MNVTSKPFTSTLVYIIACINLGMLLQQLNQNEQAASYYKQALRLDPKNSQAFCQLGKIRQSQQLDKQAIKLYQHAVRQLHQHWLDQDPFS